MALTEKEAAEMEETIDRGEPCPSCKAEWKPLGPGLNSREMWHRDDCEYIDYHENEGSN